MNHDTYTGHSSSKFETCYLKVNPKPAEYIDVLA